MLVVKNRRLKKRYAIGGSGILDSILQFLVKTFTSQGAKQVASSAAKEIGKTVLDAGKTLAVEAGKKLISKKLDDIMSKYTGNKFRRNGGGNVVAIEDMVRKLNGSGLKQLI